MRGDGEGESECVITLLGIKNFSPSHEREYVRAVATLPANEAIYRCAPTVCDVSLAETQAAVAPLAGARIRTAALLLACCLPSFGVGPAQGRAVAVRE